MVIKNIINMNVLSLFDGMSCGQIALNNLGIEINTYYACEIDNPAINITKKNFPKTIHLGDVTKIKAKDLPKIDLIIGGSPCQSFSNMGDGSGFDGKSGLFWEYVRLLNECKPKYFLLENVLMKKEWQEVITNAMGVKPIKINSALVSHQRRNRLYWTNIPNIQQPTDKGLKFQDIIEKNVDSRYSLTERAIERVREKQGFDLVKDKAKCLFATYYKNNSNSREGQIIEDENGLRRLTPTECEILQTVPVGYTEGVSDTQRYKMLGNGWTVSVIEHLFKDMLNDVEPIKRKDFTNKPLFDISYKKYNMKEHKYKYDWNLKDAVFTKDRGSVFSCFACGGGSTMGYKLSGFDVLGCNEIDPRMIEAYRTNHKPKYSFLESITTFKDRKDLPEDLYNLDILDGSPPCSSFSMAGLREEAWGKQKKFREGQSLQVLDTLFFDFIDLAKELQPKVVVAENVKGLLMGNAKEYVEKIYKAFDEAGYYCQHFLLNSSKMSVPQRRERVFFISLRKDLAKPFMDQKDLFNKKPKINLDFNEPGILFEEIYDGLGKPITEYKMKAFECRQPNDNGIADSKRHAGMKVSDYNCVYVKHDKVMPTITGKAEHAMLLYNEPIKPSDTELRKGGTYPMDYEFSNIGYLIGMSVPPVMTAQVADRIYDQWLNKIK